MWVWSKSLTLGACFRRSSCFALLSAVRTKRADNINLTDCVINWRDDVRLVLVWHCWLWMSLHFCGHTHHFRKSIIQIQTRTIFWPKRLDRDAAGLDPLMDKDLKEKKKKTCHETFGRLQVGQYPLILLESKRSVSHCHSVLVADALSQMPFKPHQSAVFFFFFRNNTAFIYFFYQAGQWATDLVWAFLPVCSSHLLSLRYTVR